MDTWADWVASNILLNIHMVTLQMIRPVLGSSASSDALVVVISPNVREVHGHCLEITTTTEHAFNSGIENRQLCFLYKSSVSLGFVHRRRTYLS